MNALAHASAHLYVIECVCCLSLNANVNLAFSNPFALFDTLGREKKSNDAHSHAIICRNQVVYGNRIDLTNVFVVVVAVHLIPYRAVYSFHLVQFIRVQQSVLCSALIPHGLFLFGFSLRFFRVCECRLYVFTCITRLLFHFALCRSSNSFGFFFSVYFFFRSFVCSCFLFPNTLCN